MKNKYEIRGDVTAIFINSKKYGKMESLISTSKLDRAQDFGGTWCVNWSEITKSFYVQACTSTVNGKQTIVRLHRWITNARKGIVVDHHNHDTLNNTDDNMRFCTQAENLQNRKGAQLNSKSGIRGVCWNKGAGKWNSQIRLNGKQIYLGRFSDIRDAEIAVKEARAKYMPYSKDAI